MDSVDVRGSSNNTSLSPCVEEDQSSVHLLPETLNITLSCLTWAHCTNSVPISFPQKKKNAYKFQKVNGSHGHFCGNPLASLPFPFTTLELHARRNYFVHPPLAGGLENMMQASSAK